MTGEVGQLKLATSTVVAAVKVACNGVNRDDWCTGAALLTPADVNAKAEAVPIAAAAAAVAASRSFLMMCASLLMTRNVPV